MAINKNLFRLGFEISPVIFAGGIAQNIPGGFLPIVAITQASSFTMGLLQGEISASDLDKYACHWRPAPGGTLRHIEAASYPYLNTSSAVNATFEQPLAITMIMDMPINENTNFVSKLATIESLIEISKTHTQLGGTYIVATPATIYNNCLLRRVTDITPASDRLPQRQFQFEFVKPLISNAGAERVLNSYLSKVAGGERAEENAFTTIKNSLGNTSLGSLFSSELRSALGEAFEPITGLFGFTAPGK